MIYQRGAGVPLYILTASTPADAVDLSSMESIHVRYTTPRGRSFRQVAYAGTSQLSANGQIFPAGTWVMCIPAELPEAGPYLFQLEYSTGLGHVSFGKVAQLDVGDSLEVC